MYLDAPDIELLDDDFERMAPFLDITQIQLSWSTDEPLECNTLPRPLDAWRDKFKDRGAITAARKQGQGTFSRFSTANETKHIGYIEDGRKEVRMQLRAKQYTAFAKIPPFGSIDGNVTSASPLKIGSLVYFVLKRGIIPVSCDASNIGEEQLSIGFGLNISR
ncbi:BQ5605_C011g06250 [Microbotryum silenes-dioicae]|uniref:BQ5605_C011g06250 protein n=1 Tax=Microbotryum silenes-dioicae TaxID=796604 RepID=A0A2X0LT12_9BASI|nr:BQ5605_C011g06250 [Microbotryum silenes-dioicae]